MGEPCSVDCAIVGGGPAGLVASLYLLRFRRSVLIADRGSGRAQLIPRSHNVPAFPDGIAGSDLIQRLWSQVRQQGTPVRTGEVDAIVPAGPRWILRVGPAQFVARKVLLAAGVADLWPDIPGAEQALRQRVLRFCPVCDGHEILKDVPVAVIGCSDHAVREARFLRTYASRICILASSTTVPDEQRDRLSGAGIRILDIRPETARFDSGHLVVEERSGGAIHTFAVAYSALGMQPQVQLLASMGVSLDEGGYVRVDSHQRTNIGGVYAAGDVVRGLNQISVAMGEAAIAATAMHNDLRNPDEAEAPTRLEGLLLDVTRAGTQ